jgi:hypothetical protein
MEKYGYVLNEAILRYNKGFGLGLSGEGGGARGLGNCFASIVALLLLLLLLSCVHI